MSWPFEPYDGAETLARIEYGYTRSLLIKLDTVGVDSKASALKWAHEFQEIWVRSSPCLMWPTWLADARRTSFISERVR